MKSVGFRFNLDEKVEDETSGFSGTVMLCAIQGAANEPEKVYLIESGGETRWIAENNLKEA